MGFFYKIYKEWFENVEGIQYVDHMDINYCER